MNNSQTPAEPITKDVIVTEAASLFSERGYRRTKVTDIARAAGITPPSLYWHFSSKEEILFEYLRGGLVEFNSQIETALDGCGNEIGRASCRERGEGAGGEVCGERKQRAQ